MFAAHPQPGGNLFGPEWLLHVTYHQVPGAQLEWLREAEHTRPVPEEASALRGQCGATHQFTGHGIVHTLNHQRCYPALPACSQRLAVIGSERCPRHHGQRRKVLPDVAQHREAGAKWRQNHRVEEPTGGEAPECFGASASSDAHPGTGHRAPQDGTRRPGRKHGDE